MKKSDIKMRVLHMVVAPDCPFCLEESRPLEINKFYDQYLAYPVCNEHSEKFSGEDGEGLNVN